MTNTSPPIPVIIGSATFSTAAAVTAASMALPPRWSTDRPAAVASGWLVAIMPCGAYTVERWAMVVGRGSWAEATAAKQASAAASAIERAVMPGISLRAGLPPPLPRKVRRRPRRHDPETDQRLHRPGHDGVQDDRYRRGDVHPWAREREPVRGAEDRHENHQRHKLRGGGAEQRVHHIRRDPVGR